MAADEDLAEITRLKKARNAVILAHNYMTPDIFHGVADIRGDSLALAREAAKADADVIVVAGVHFMAETAKLLNPSRVVLCPDMRAGCSLSDSITPGDVRALREKHPKAPVVTYVNTSAAVKAESDICCTSGNAKKVVESLGAKKVIMLPDEYLAKNTAAETGVEIICWKGRCEVHERFTASEIKKIREKHEGIKIIAHPECPSEVVAEADYNGSTAGMIDWVESIKPKKAFLATEVSMSDNLAASYPETEFVRPPYSCPHMKLIGIKSIRAALENMEHIIEIPEETAAHARKAVERMIAVR